MVQDVNLKYGGLDMWKPWEGMTDHECNLDYFMDEIVMAGDPAAVTREILALREQIGPFGTLVLVAHDWDDRDRSIRSLELFANEVVPAVDRALAA